MLKQIEDVEYHIYETVESKKVRKTITNDQSEAEYWYKEGKIVYEVHKVAYQSEWMVSTLENFYEWH